MSPPSRRRGLKNPLTYADAFRNLVASFAEAWIEKVIPFDIEDLTESPPSRRRGLKML